MEHQPRSHPILTRREVLGALVATTLVPWGRGAATPADVATCLRAGRAAYGLYSAAGMALARTWLHAALAHDVRHAPAWALLAATYRQEATMGWTTNVPQAEARARQAAEQAVDLARQAPAPHPALPACLEQLGFVRLYQDDHAGCIQAAQAILAHPQITDATRARALALWGHALAYLGQPTAALTHLDAAAALAQPVPVTIRYNLGHALAVQGYYTGARAVYAQAETELRAVLAEAPSYRPARTYLTVVLWEQGKHAEARGETQHMAGEGRLSPHDPGFAAYIRRAHPCTDAAYLARLIAVWQAAATPAHV